MCIYIYIYIYIYPFPLHIPFLSLQIYIYIPSTYTYLWQQCQTLPRSTSLGDVFISNILEVDSMCPAPTWIFSSWILSNHGLNYWRLNRVYRIVGIIYQYKGMLGIISTFLHLVGGSTQLKLGQNGFIFPIFWGENKTYFQPTTHQNLTNWLHNQPFSLMPDPKLLKLRQNLRQNRGEKCQPKCWSAVVLRHCHGVLWNVPVRSHPLVIQFMGIISWGDASMDILKTNAHTHILHDCILAFGPSCKTP